MRRLMPFPALLIAAATPVLAQEAPPPPPHAGMAHATTLDVVAEGSSSRVPDVVEISAGVVTTAATADEALRGNASRMTAVVTALKRASVAERDIQTSSLSLQPQYKYENNQPPVLTGYQASNQVTATFRDIKGAGKIIDALVANGANQINGPSFRVDKPDAALDEARTAAVARARARAELYARAAGLSVARIVSISESDATPPRPYPMMAMAKRSMDATPVEPGEQKLSVTLQVRFELK